MVYPDKVSVFHKLRILPTPSDSSSFILDVLMLSDKHQRPSARCVEDIVVYDYKAGKKTNMKPWMLDIFQETFRRQKEEKERNLKRVKGLLEEVRKLELETWDRPDAKEDFGSAKV